MYPPGATRAGSLAIDLPAGGGRIIQGSSVIIEVLITS
ncbi:hypothetical protein LCL96_08035 [Rossellomorea aquimaris]|nr:hypothetical protein [Rossellomorea aquimaris]MCA1058880.1 hypothetical protein [Rossellomorea aquimaris]